MPEKQMLEKAAKAKREGKSPSTQSGEFVREEMHHIRQGKHGARSTKQAIAIGLSKARRAGVNLPPPKKGRVSEKTRRSAQRAYETGQKRKSRPSRRRSQSRERALKREASQRGIAQSTAQACALCCATTLSGGALRRSPTCGPHQGPARTFYSSTEGRTHTRSRLICVREVKPPNRWGSGACPEATEGLDGMMGIASLHPSYYGRL